MDEYHIDKHKLHLHPQRVADWLKGEAIYPIYMEVSPFGGCNHRCLFCGLDFMKYKPQALESEMFSRRLSELGRLGVKSIMYAGEGEPFFHPDMAALTARTRQCGIDPAFSTNGVLMTPDISEKILDCTSWIKVSWNAATAETYARIHRTDAKDFYQLIENLEAAVRLRHKQNSACTLGAQMILLPENAHETETMAGLCRDLGLDYLVIKPYSKHPQSRHTRYDGLTYEAYEELAERLIPYNTEQYSVIFRMNTIRKWNRQQHDYARCLALPFWSYIDSSGYVWGCSVYLRDDTFFYGNIYDRSFEEIWKGERRTRSLQWCRDNLDPAQCRVNCRMDEINRYLWELKTPHPHVNFI